MSNDPKKPLTEVPVKKGGKNLPPSRPKPSTPPPSQTPKRNWTTAPNKIIKENRVSSIFLREKLTKRIFLLESMNSGNVYTSSTIWLLFLSFL